MRTDIDVDDELLAEAMAVFGLVDFDRLAAVTALAVVGAG
jgi:Arc/MetJ family transcription regulator